MDSELCLPLYSLQIVVVEYDVESAPVSQPLNVLEGQDPGRVVDCQEPQVGGIVTFEDLGELVPIHVQVAYGHYFQLPIIEPDQGHILIDLVEVNRSDSEQLVLELHLGIQVHGLLLLVVDIVDLEGVFGETCDDLMSLVHTPEVLQPLNICFLVVLFDILRSGLVHLGYLLVFEVDGGDFARTSHCEDVPTLVEQDHVLVRVLQGDLGGC